MWIILQACWEDISGTSHSRAPAVHRCPCDVSEEFAEHTALVLEACAVVLGPPPAVLGTLQSTEQPSVLDVEVSEQGVDLTRADHIRLLLWLLALLLLASWPRLVLLLTMMMFLLLLLLAEPLELFVVLQFTLQALHHVFLLESL